MNVSYIKRIISITHIKYRYFLSYLMWLIIFIYNTYFLYIYYYRFVHLTTQLYNSLNSAVRLLFIYTVSRRTITFLDFIVYSFNFITLLAITASCDTRFYWVLNTYSNKPPKKVMNKMSYIIYCVYIEHDEK